jgi:hypothetical protein
LFNWYRISMCFTCFLCQLVFNKRFLKIYCLSVQFLSCFIYFNVYNIENYQQKVFRGEFNLDIFFTCWSHFLWNNPYAVNEFGRCISSYNTMSAMKTPAIFNEWEWSGSSSYNTMSAMKTPAIFNEWEWSGSYQCMSCQ